jgi:hypothetical protein
MHSLVGIGGGACPSSAFNTLCCGRYAVAVNIAIVGLSLYASGFSGVANCPQLGLPMMAALIITSQYLRNVGLPKRIPFIGG